MRHVMVINAKGGCGKSTLSTNIACHFAREGERVALADFDPQRSSLDWLAARPENLPPIAGIAAFTDGFKVPRDTEVVVIDAPAGAHDVDLSELVRRAETIVVPVLASPVDMRACAHFMEELLDQGKVQRDRARVAVVANRVRENTLIFEELDKYLGKLDVPYLGALRQSANYLRAFEKGMGIFELAEYLAGPDWEQWQPITKWLASKKSQPPQ